MKIPGYKVHRKLGSGGMASVYLATQEAFDRKVALKVIATKDFDSDKAAERFVQEAKTVARFSHPHIVSVYDVGRVGPIHYLAMDYLQGGTLSDWIRAGLEPAEAVQITDQIAQALHYAHNKGYIHRDVKTDNIMFREDNSAVLMDFGIAKPVRDDNSVNLTQVGLVVGTPSFMAPEQSQGKAIDGRADLYSLGVIFYQMLTRELPYRDTDPLALALQHIQAPIPKLPPSLARYQPIIERLLAKVPEQRFRNGLELCKALKAVEQPTAEPAPPVQSGTQRSTSTQSAATAPTRHEMSMADEAATQAASSASDLRGTRLSVEENPVRVALLFKRYALHCEYGATTSQDFEVVFSTFTGKLLTWQSERGDKCHTLSFLFFVTPDIVERVKTVVETLYREATFDFVKRLNVHMTIKDPAGTTLFEQTVKKGQVK